MQSKIVLLPLPVSPKIPKMPFFVKISKSIIVRSVKLFMPLNSSLSGFILPPSAKGTMPEALPRPLHRTAIYSIPKTAETPFYPYRKPFPLRFAGFEPPPLRIRDFPVGATARFDLPSKAR